MDILTWDDSMAIGVPEIDEQHKGVFVLLQAVTEAAQMGADQKELVFAVEKLIEYGAWHFAAEEKLLDQSGYPQAKAHKQLHHEYTKKVYYMKVGCMEKSCSMAEVAGFLNDWWVTHIKGADMALGRHLTQKASA